MRFTVNETYNRGGKVIVPAFAVGRTRNRLRPLRAPPGAQDSRRPSSWTALAVDATEIFRLHPECYDKEMEELLEKDQYGPLGHNHVRYVRRVDDSKELNFLREPAIIISASGMAEGGRILHHLKNNLEDKRNTVLFVGYQAEHAGASHPRGSPTARIFDEEYPVRAQWPASRASAHASHEGSFATRRKPPRPVA